MYEKVVHLVEFSLNFLWQWKRSDGRPTYVYTQIFPSFLQVIIVIIIMKFWS